MPRVTVRPRAVPRPWQRWQGQGAVRLGDEDSVFPPAGPLALYLRAWPHRRVVWNRKRQLWEIRQRNPVSGRDERIELLCELDAEPQGGAPDWTPDELAALLQRRDPRLSQVYQPFDYPFVLRRLRERAELVRVGPAVQTARRIARNEARARRRWRAFAQNAAAMLGELRRWIPAAASGHAHDRLPLVRGGLHN